MEIKDYLKTAESRAVIQEQGVFCVDGRLWQGYRGGPMPVEESQLSLEELKDVVDKDQTMHKVWFRVAQRLESRYDQKSNEYGKRRSTLRAEREAIRNSMKNDRELGIAPSPVDVSEIARIDRRMVRLADLKLEEDYIYAKDHSYAPGDEPPPPVDESVPETPVVEQGACPECGALSPPGRDFDKWLRGHKVGAHKQKKAASA